ncbi:hypothetical protein VTK56DRAFT_7044 [Thermocarpiscus australiensis]
MTGRLRCAQGGEWKTRDHYSQNQLSKYDREARKGKASPAQTGINCKEHSSKQALELQCNGPCGSWRELRHFSKNTRRNGKNWCLDCTEWQVRTENGETLPPPGSQFSVDESRLFHPAHMSGKDVVTFDDGYEDLGTIESVHETQDGISDLTPALRQSDQQGDAADILADSVNDSRAEDEILDEFIPPHLRGPEPAKAPEWFLPDLDGPLSTAPEPCPGKPVPFNAWGPNGEYARQVKTPTVVSGSTYGGEENQKPADRGKKSWAKPSQRKRPPQLPDYLKYDIPVVEQNDFDEDSADEWW